MTTNDNATLRHIPTSPEMEAIAAIKDPALRNLQITLAYHDITLAMADMLGKKDLTWCAFGAWASKTAGIFIRNEEAPAFVRTFLEDTRRVLSDSHLLAPLRAAFGSDVSLEPLLTVVARRALDSVAAEIGQGNLMVFQEIGIWFARMIETFHGDTAPDPAKLSRFLSQFKPGPVRQGGQDLLIKAFTNYYAAMFEQDPKKKSELIFLANAQTGYQEQTRVDPRVKGGLEAPVAVMLFEALPVSFMEEDPIAELKEKLEALKQQVIEMKEQVEENLSMLMARVARSVQDTWRKLTTRWLMRLNLPEGALDMGRDIPALSSGKMFPAEIETIDNIELRALLYELDRSPNTLVGSAASDWADLGERMHYIVDLFRSRQQASDMLKAPFTPAQIEVIRRGGLPQGSL
ncbi:hypothetical protein SOCE26_074380 [Sorangium cellulosum]|uniref:Uncharacterized protein n=1 Tax=Sorangium cellulosum TaxID=56 RepID=A0A2L0F319_SORCE|nr:hypothetical protein [Sorangium cellulosum]AUX45936.1 hypothetical protein SOCE26_074380 [Sorangium cellulosum]